MSADSGEIPAQQIVDQVVEPVFVGAAVVVGERDDLTGGGTDARVARGGEALVGLTEVTNGGKAAGNFRCAVSRTIVHEDDFVVWIVQAGQRFEEKLERARTVKSGDHD